MGPRTDTAPEDKARVPWWCATLAHVFQTAQKQPETCFFGPSLCSHIFAPSPFDSSTAPEPAMYVTPACGEDSDPNPSVESQVHSAVDDVLCDMMHGVQCSGDEDAYERCLFLRDKLRRREFTCLRSEVARVLKDRAELKSRVRLDLMDDFTPAVNFLRSFAEGNVNKRKRSRKQRSQQVRQNEKAARGKRGGAKKVKPNEDRVPRSVNKRTCLLDAVLALLPGQEKRAVAESVASAMPTEGDTAPEDIAGALSRHGLLLVRSSGDFCKRGGPPAHWLLQQRRCQLVVHLSITDHEGVVHSHYVAWDGETIHDKPHCLRVSRSDRASPQSSKAALDKHCSDYLRWEVTSVHRLARSSTSAVASGAAPSAVCVP